MMRDQRMETARLAKGKIRVLVADREGIFRLGLKKLLAVEDDLRVVAKRKMPPKFWRERKLFGRIWPSSRKKSSPRVTAT